MKGSAQLFENFGDKVQIRNRTKVVEIIIRKRRFFEYKLIACLNADTKIPLDKEKLDSRGQVCLSRVSKGKWELSSSHCLF